MKIAILASNYKRVPPVPDSKTAKYSGAIERIVYFLTQGLVKRGHQVTLFASGDSKTNARLFSVTKKATIDDTKIDKKDYENFEYLLISQAFSFLNKNHFDLIHSHLDIKSAFFSPFCKIPMLSTLHSPLDKITPFLSFYKNSQFYVSISNAQRKVLPDLNYIATVYNGIDCQKYSFEEKRGNYLIYVGRLVEEKGASLAIKTAKKLGKKLIVLGGIRRSVKKEAKYYQEEIKPFVDGKMIELHGFINRIRLREYLQRAVAILFPIRWEEPFGLVMIESMACGTPVVAFARGSVPEVIKDGETGFIVNSSDEDKRGNWIVKKTGLEGLREAVERIYSMPKEKYQAMRRACRAHVEANFTVEKMVENYEKVYQKILAVSK